MEKAAAAEKEAGLAAFEAAHHLRPGPVVAKKHKTDHAAPFHHTNLVLGADPTRVRQALLVVLLGIMHVAST